MKRLVVTLWLLVAGVSNAVPADHGYTFSCWPNGWRKHANDRSPDIFAVETSHYGFTLNVADFRQAAFGLLNNPVGYEQALDHGADKLKTLPAAQLLIEIDVDDTRYRAVTCKAGREKGVKHLSSVRLWESGRYVQHYDFLGLDFRDARGRHLDCDATLDLVAWPQHLTFNLGVSGPLDGTKAVLRLGLISPAGRWRKELTVSGPWTAQQRKTLSMTCSVPSAGPVPPATVAVRAADGRDIAVRFDRSKNCYLARVDRLKRDWKTGYTDIRNYDDFQITVTGPDTKAAVPFLLDLRAPANITGVCPLLCDREGRPTGIPVQLSKNWHYKPMGAYVMAYTMLPPRRPATYLLRLVYGFYGTLPSASHAQLSLVGYGGHGRWDQLAIGCWGETICFDMDMSLVDVAITDIRMLMTRAGLDGRQWAWTEAGWGGDWLYIQDAAQKKYFRTDLKTAYLSQGPCLTRVKHTGYYGAHREVAFSAEVQTLRTDDYNRVFQRFDYTFARDVAAEGIWLFKLGRTFNYHTPRIAYGNGDGLLAQVDAPNTLRKGDRALDHVTLTGPGPYWVALPGARYTTGNKPDGYRALIVRHYEVVAGGQTYRRPTLNAPVYKADPTNLDIELLPPNGLRRFRPGDRITLGVELITLPRRAEDYYGPNEAFRRHLANNPNSWKTTYREATGNDLEVEVSGGRLLRRYPVIVQADTPSAAPGVTVTIHGGVGAVPIQFRGLKDSAGYRLYRVAGNRRIALDQSVHGNDFWQTDYDADTDSYALTFNLPLDGLDESRWILTRP